MPGMDLELLSGLQNMEDSDDMNSAVAAMMGALAGGGGGNMMGAEAFNYLAGMADDDDDDPRQVMLGAIAGYNPELAMMMGWNPFSTVWKGIKKVGRFGKKAGRAILPGAVGNLLFPMAQAAALQRAAKAASPFAQPTPLSAVQPQLPGVPDRGGRVQPLGFENGAFTSAGPAVVTIRARPQRPLRGGRLVADFTRTGVTATGLLTLVQLVVATDGQLLSGDPISFAALSPNAFGVGVNLSPAAVGNEIFATVAVSALPAMADRIDFNLTLFGLTVG